MKEDEFKKLYLGEFPVTPPAVVACYSYQSALHAAKERNISQIDMRYIGRIEQLMAIGHGQEWKTAANAPLLLCINYDLWEKAKSLGIVTD